MDVREISIIYHVGIVLGVLWICSCFNWCHPILFFLSLIYLYMVHDCYIVRLRKKLQFEERKQAYQKRVLSDSESVRWLNHAVEKIWPVCMEQIASQKILLPIIPWFLEKYKPWTAKKAVVQSLYLGRNPPMITEMRVLRQCSDDDHLVMELGMNFLTADDMSAILAVQLRRRLGFGMWAKLHVTGMHVEGKVLVGVKFLREWPFLGRLRVCFVEPPYFQMTVKPIVSHGLDVTELPGIAGWLDKLLSVAFEQTLVEPNMLVVDMEKFASGSTTESWFTVDEKDPIAYAKVELIEAADMKPSDPNGLADPYVKGQLGPYRFRTKIQKKTLAPKWQEEFKIPICSWDSPNVLALEVRDKDHFVDDILGDCVVNINDAKDGQRRDMWIPLQNIKMGRLHLAVTVLDVNAKGEDCKHDENALDKKESTNTIASEPIKDASKPIASSKTSQRVADDFEPINVEGQQQTGIWVHHPGSDVSQTWEPRKRNRMADIQIPREDNDSVDTPRSGASGTNNTCDSSSEENLDGNKSKSFGSVRRSIRKIGSVFRSPKGDAPCILEEPSPRHVNIRAENEKPPILNIIRDSDTSGAAAIGSKELSQTLSPERNETAVAGKGHMKVMAKSILKHAGNGLKHVLSRKGSKKTRGDITMGTDSDSSEYSLSSSMHYRSTDGDTSSELAPNSPNGMKSPDPKERTVHSSTDELTTVKNVSFKGGDITIPDVHQEEPPNPDVHREETPTPDIHREDTASPVGHGGQLDSAIIDKTSQENR